MLLVNAAISNLIREGKTFQLPSMMQVGKASGMVMLNDALFELVKAKTITREEALLKSVDKAGMETMLKRLGVAVCVASGQRRSLQTPARCGTPDE